jgi:hypothetical protein
MPRARCIWITNNNELFAADMPQLKKIKLLLFFFVLKGRQGKGITKQLISSKGSNMKQMKCNATSRSLSKSN